MTKQNPMIEEGRERAKRCSSEHCKDGYCMNWHAPHACWVKPGPYVADEHGTPITGLSWCAAQPHEKKTSHCPACGVGPMEACRGRIPQDDGEARDPIRLMQIAQAAMAQACIATDEIDLRAYRQTVEAVIHSALRAAGGTIDPTALAHPQQGGDRDGGGLDLTVLRAANIARQNEWCPEQHPDLSFRGNELAGETGEACNIIKKLERERQGWRGSRATLIELGDELADIVICADLCALTARIDLSASVIAKFNATSEKVGISVRLPTAPTLASKSSGE